MPSAATVVAATEPPGPQPVAIKLVDPDAQNATLFGAKAANLARLVRTLSGSIPPGIVLPADSARLVAELGDSHPAVRAELVAALGGHDVVARSRYAVRSSGADEDSYDHSFAGQYETVLGVRSIAGVVEAIRRCVRSEHSGRIDAYRQRVPTSYQAPRVPAVLVQQMVPADRAGVAFTVNPVTRADEVVINAAYGLGDVIVGGEVTPDEIVTDASGNPRSTVIGTKRLMTIMTETGTRNVAVPASMRATRCLSDSHVRDIVDVALRCRDVLGYAVDIEWAIQRGTTFLSQARPITTRPMKGQVSSR